MAALPVPAAALLSDALLRTGFGYLMLMTVTMARLSIMVLVLPVFTRAGLTGLRRLAVALALSLPVAWHLSGSIDQLLAADPAWVVLLLTKEAVVGLLLGLGFGVPFWAATSMGDVLDLQRGSSMAYLTDPTAIDVASMSGTFFELILVGLFYVGGGPDLMLQALYESYRLWPAFAALPPMSADTAPLVLGLIDRVMELALLLGGPLFVVLFMVEAAMALVARMAPQLHVFYVTLPVKAIALFTVLPAYAIFFVHHARPALSAGRGVLTEIGRFLP
ncbi:EscT/YscT/HrcT family type III secretion system export apparatus protein [Aliidongia dinghuensis]|uniref:EscT/YscT/HrcT family type III secretion system export apparatus protein n=1 Tax=Aliidongia dinghuensis TaxID=1867774 RepID=A0A8J3E1Y7_9PROT|nr:type III secretion system export apparatus subunit SctT [Aliidongia dinghuensis]GGF05316.1 EscT/YscT/HrcT family type III secretion system export apparatus protein [Aliidongia dinghuensis]